MSSDSDGLGERIESESDSGRPAKANATGRGGVKSGVLPLTRPAKAPKVSTSDLASSEDELEGVVANGARGSSARSIGEPVNPGMEISSDEEEIPLSKRKTIAKAKGKPKPKPSAEVVELSSGSEDDKAKPKPRADKGKGRDEATTAKPEVPLHLRRPTKDYVVEVTVEIPAIEDAAVSESMRRSWKRHRKHSAKEKASTEAPLHFKKKERENDADQDEEMPLAQRAEKKKTASPNAPNRRPRSPSPASDADADAEDSDVEEEDIELEQRKPSGVKPKKKRSSSLESLSSGGHGSASSGSGTSKKSSSSLLMKKASKHKATASALLGTGKKRPRSPSPEVHSPKSSAADQSLDDEIAVIADYALPTSAIKNNRLKDLAKGKMVLNGVKAVPNGVKVTPKTATAPPSAKKQKKLYHTDSEGESLGRGQLREKKLDRTGDARRSGLAKLKALKEARKSGVAVSSMGLAEESQSGSGSDDDAISVDSSDLDKDEEGFIAPDDSDGEAAELPAQFSSKRHYSIEESVTKAIELYLMTNFHVEDFPSQVREAKDSSLLEILEPIEDLLRKIDARKKQIPEAQWPRDFVHALDMFPRRIEEKFQSNVKEKCVACQKTQTIAYRLTLKGVPYDRFSGMSRNELKDKGHEPSVPYSKKAPAQGPFPLGQTCMEKVERYDSLAHVLHNVRADVGFIAKDWWQKYAASPTRAEDKKRLEKRGKEDFWKDHWSALARGVYKDYAQNSKKLEWAVDLVVDAYEKALVFDR